MSSSTYSMLYVCPEVEVKSWHIAPSPSVLIIPPPPNPELESIKTSSVAVGIGTPPAPPLATDQWAVSLQFPVPPIQ